MNKLSNSVIADEFAQISKQNGKKAVIVKLIPLISLVVVVIVFGIISPRFLTFVNLYRNILDQCAITLVLASGMTFIILLGSIDLSAEGVVGAAGCIIALLVQNSKTSLNLGILGAVLTILFGGLLGLLSGWIHVKFRLPSFIVTFAMSSFAYGIGCLTYRGYPATILDAGLRNLYYQRFLQLPGLSWIAIAVFLICLFIEKKTVFGRYVFAVGENESSAKMSGINVNRVTILAFAIFGLCMGVAGIIGAAKLGTGQIYIGTGCLFPAITAVVVGGTSLAGGKGGLLNTLVGVLFVTVLNNGMIMVNVPTDAQSAVHGVLILISVVLSAERSRKKIIK